MGFRKTLTFLILSMALLFALPAGAQPEVAPGFSPAHADVAPTFRSARDDVAASLPRHGGVKLPLHQTVPPPAIRMHELPVVECPHIIVVIPACGRCRCGVDRS